MKPFYSLTLSRYRSFGAGMAQIDEGVHVSTETGSGRKWQYLISCQSKEQIDAGIEEVEREINLLLARVFAGEEHLVIEEGAQ